MNTGTVTGGVIKAAENAYTPQGLRRVVFPVVVSDSQRVRAPWNCEAEGSNEFLDWLVERAQPGRGIKLDYELATRPFNKKGVHVGEVRFLRVIKAEFPERQPKAENPDVT